MRTEQQGVLRPNPRKTRKIAAFLRIGGALIVVGIYAYSGGIYLHTPIRFHWSCPDNRHCAVTIRNEGGGFDHGFNPAYQWTMTGDDAGGVRFAPTSGTVQSGQTMQVQVVVTPGSCPTTITITSSKEIFNFSPFQYDRQTGRCDVPEPSGSTE